MRLMRIFHDSKIGYPRPFPILLLFICGTGFDLGTAIVRGIQ